MKQIIAKVNKKLNINCHHYAFVFIAIPTFTLWILKAKGLISDENSLVIIIKIITEILSFIYLTYILIIKTFIVEQK